MTLHELKGLSAAGRS